MARRPGAGGPACHAELEQKEAHEAGAADSLSDGAGQDAQQDAGGAHQQSPDCGDARHPPVREQGVDAGHPERAGGVDNGGEAGGGQEFGQRQKAVADADTDNAASGGLEELGSVAAGGPPEPMPA